MQTALSPVRLTLVALFASALLPGAVLAQGSASTGAVSLASHRAVYDLKLATTRGKRPMSGVRGRILYDFSGNACEGYALQFRQVSELDSGEGRTMVSDLRATTWEEAGSKRLRFHSQNFLDDKLRDSVDGQAERAIDGISVKLTQPSDKSFDLGVDFVFPTEHVRRIIEAARDGKRLLQVSVYDGSETGEKTYDTLTIIGQPIAPDTGKPTDAAGKESALAGLRRWPVTISYFEKGGKSGADGEQTPVYAITFELYENGVSRALLLDYNDFVVSGEMTSIEMKDAKPCP